MRRMGVTFGPITHILASFFPQYLADPTGDFGPRSFKGFDKFKFFNKAFASTPFPVPVIAITKQNNYKFFLFFKEDFLL